MPRGVFNKLRSVELMLEFVHGYVMKRADKGKALVVVTRHSEDWGLRAGKNIVEYKSSETRRANLNRRSPGGREIADWIGIDLAEK